MCINKYFLSGVLLFLSITDREMHAQQEYLQKMTITDPQPAFGTVPPDTNNSLLIVQSTIPNLKFKSTLGVLREENIGGGEWRLHLIADVQIISFMADKFETKKIRIAILKKNQAFEIRISTPTITEVVGDLRIESNPPGAKIFLNNVDANKLTPNTFDNIKVSEIRLEKERYEAATRRVQLDPSKVAIVSVNLKPQFGYITVDTRHTDAAFFINGIQKNFQVGNPIEVNVGELSIELKKQYYHDFVTKVRVDPNDDPQKSITVHIELVRQKGRLVVDTNPPNAKVYLANSKFLGDTPLDQFVDAGKYILEAKKDNYRTEQITVEVLNNQTTSEIIKLYRNGIIHVEGTQGASVYINGNYEGIIPIQNKIIEQGQYRIRIQKEGYDIEETTFTVKAEQKMLTYNLIKSKWRAFRWTGFGNQRISSILTSLSLSAGYFKLPGTSKTLVYTVLIPAPPFPDREIKTDVHLNDIQGLATDVSVFFPPLTFTFGLGLPASQPGLVVTNKGLVYYGNANWTPFVLYEVLYPSIGINYTSGEFEYRVIPPLGRETIEKLKYTSWGLHYELRLSTYNKKGNGFFGGFFLKFGYSDYFDNKSGLEKLLYINGGVWWGSQRHE